MAPEGSRLLGMIRNNAKRIDRIVGEVLQLNRRDRQQPEVIAFDEFVASLVEAQEQLTGARIVRRLASVSFSSYCFCVDSATSCAVPSSSTAWSR